VPGFEASALNGIGAPKNTPNQVVDRLNREINAILADAKMKARIAEVEGEALTGGLDLVSGRVDVHLAGGTLAMLAGLARFIPACGERSFSPKSRYL
jgi:hypothetical protein